MKANFYKKRTYGLGIMKLLVLEPNLGKQRILVFRIVFGQFLL